MIRNLSTSNQPGFVMKFGEQIHAVIFDKQPVKCCSSRSEMSLLVPFRPGRFPVRYQRLMKEALCFRFQHL